MANDFKAGDVVRLKSGGPAMTVASQQEDGRLWCVWFGEGKAVGQPFPAAVLRPTDEDMVVFSARTFEISEGEA